MKKIYLFCVCTAFTVAMTGCGAKTITPNYTTIDADQMQIGGKKPADKEPEIINMGSYCLQVTDKWKVDGKTPDGQEIYSKDTFRKAVPCK